MASPEKQCADQNHTEAQYLTDEKDDPVPAPENATVATDNIPQANHEGHSNTLNQFFDFSTGYDVTIYYETGYESTRKVLLNQPKTFFPETASQSPLIRCSDFRSNRVTLTKPAIMSQAPYQNRQESLDIVIVENSGEVALLPGGSGFKVRGPRMNAWCHEHHHALSGTYCPLPSTISSDMVLDDFKLPWLLPTSYKPLAELKRPRTIISALHDIHYLLHNLDTYNDWRHIREDRQIKLMISFGTECSQLEGFDKVVVDIKTIVARNNCELSLLYHNLLFLCRQCTQHLCEELLSEMHKQTTCGRIQDAKSDINIFQIMAHYNLMIVRRQDQNIPTIPLMTRNLQTMWQEFTNHLQTQIDIYEEFVVKNITQFPDVMPFIQDTTLEPQQRIFLEGTVSFSHIYRDPEPQGRCYYTSLPIPYIDPGPYGTSPAVRQAAGGFRRVDVTIGDPDDGNDNENGSSSDHNE